MQVTALWPLRKGQILSKSGLTATILFEENERVAGAWANDWVQVGEHGT